MKHLLAFDRQHLWHPYSSTTQPPPVNLVREAVGMHITLEDGTRLIDGISSWWCMAHGHNHPKIVSAIKAQSNTFCQVMFAGFTHRPAIKLAELLLAKAPKNMEHVFYADSGSVAVECAIKMAIQYQYAKGLPQKHRMFTVKGGYHGDTAGAMAVTDPEGMHQIFGPILAHHIFAPAPVKAFDEEFSDADFAPVEATFAEHAGEIAGIIIEPVFQGASRMFFYHPGYLKKLKELSVKHDVPLILDEIATGFGRIGKFFASEYAGIEPDIMCVGKALTGGCITLAAVLSARHIGDAISAGRFGKFMHGPTFMANPLACAAGCASLELFDEYDWQNNVRKIEQTLKAGLLPLKQCDTVADVRILGAVGVVELKQIPSPETVQQIVMESKVWLRPFGHYLYTMPPFIAGEADLAAIIAAMTKFTCRG